MMKRLRRLLGGVGQASKKIVTNRWLWLIVVVLFLGNWLYRELEPELYQVLVVRPGEPLTLVGDDFGRQQGHSLVRLTSGDDLIIQYEETFSWENHQITISAPSPGGEGTVQVIKRVLFFDWPTAVLPFVVQNEDLPSQPYGYETPVQPESPWPTFRRDERNSGWSPIVAEYHRDKPWFFATGKGVFSTPVIDEGGVIYVGSADHNFYALNPDGTERWRFATGEIIDSAAALPRLNLLSSQPSILVPSGDGYLYHLATAEGLNDTERLLWQFDARVAPRASYNNWFEGNIQLGYDGTIYAGNTNFNYYAINPDGSLKWTYETGSNNWSIAGLGPDGTIYWASNDTFIRAVAPDGSERWTRRTLGFIAASAAIGSDGTVYIGSFDSLLYALDPLTGETQWTFKTNDHIYASVALGQDEAGETNAIYLASTDGLLYALNPAGELLWRYDTGDTIRSSPVVGQGSDGEIVYFGAGNGQLYALNAADGTRRWSFDTTPADAESKDRNDLNGSPALGVTGIYVAGEHGQVWYVPYDYCLNANDSRCSTTPGDDLPDEVVDFYYVTPGGNTLFAKDDTPVVGAAAMLTLRLLVRQDGATVDAWVCNSPLGCPDDALQVTIEPEFPFQMEKSADGHYIYIRPDGFLEPDTTYTVSLAGDYYTGGWNLGNWTIGGRKTAPFSSTFTFQTGPDSPAIPLRVEPDSVTAFEWTRAAVPIPPMLPSLNQIGFDYMDWIIGTVQITPPDAPNSGRMVLWAVGARRNEAGQLVADPATDFLVPFSGLYQGEQFILTNNRLTMAVTGIPIPFNLMEFRGQLPSSYVVPPGASLYADTEVLSIPTFGPYLVVGGLANNGYEKLLASGTFVTRAYEEGGANTRPQTLTVTDLTFTPPTADTPGQVVATFSGDYPADEHRPAILLVDTTHTQAVSLNYLETLTQTVDADGNLATLTLTIPAGTALPDLFTAVVMADLFPLYEKQYGPAAAPK